ncbi:hypothetical protein BST81_13150 [Leptolyngbya sp. 'hensonii']|uniref:hypothetical protein n=1 Tax=Leptolyngbya sp. 'hensonii' TaxID=1922337 RepID=UPI00094F5897|nr:hypothetical protein [Leptolyngbya sp. 'hensonii']OLP17986.1 hypothetical protein BST81_13150 [Leptolyngbya sp. 'hensonii']
MTEQTQAHPEEITRADIEIRLLGKALQDATFKQTLLSDPVKVWQQEMGDTVLKDLQLKILEENQDTLYLVLPWQDETLREGLKKRPKAIWKEEFGTTRLEGYVVRVVEEPPGFFYLVLPWADPDLPQRIPELPPTLPVDPNAPQQPTTPVRNPFQLKRTAPKTKLGRISRRLESWLALRVRSNPIVVAILRPIQKGRSWFQFWQRL